MESTDSRAWLTDPVERRGRRSDAKVTLGRRVDVLAEVPLFEGLSRREIETVARAARGSRWPAETRIVVEGGEDSFLAIILDGEVEVLKKDRRVAHLGAGDFFGEIALLDPGPRTATIRSLTEVVAVDLPREAFLRAVAEQPKALLRMLRTMAHRCRDVGAGEAPPAASA